MQVTGPDWKKMIDKKRQKQVSFHICKDLLVILHSNEIQLFSFVKANGTDHSNESLSSFWTHPCETTLVKAFGPVARYVYIILSSIEKKLHLKH